jgi:PPOX class probable F420-dependent enzyme
VRLRDSASWLRAEPVAWLTLVSDSGTPQPSPVGFLWAEDTGRVLIYSQADARRLDWLTRSDRASLHLGDDGQGRDYLVMTGSLRRLDDDHPGPDENEAFLAKYRTSIEAAFGSLAAYAATFSVPLLFTPERMRGR